MQICKYVIAQGDSSPLDHEYDDYDEALAKAQVRANLDFTTWWVLERIYAWDEDQPLQAVGPEKEE